MAEITELQRLQALHSCKVHNTLQFPQVMCGYERGDLEFGCLELNEAFEENEPNLRVQHTLQWHCYQRSEQFNLINK